MPRALHYMATDPKHGFVPSCWDGRWSFSAGQLTPDQRYVDCARCRQRLGLEDTPAERQPILVTSGYYTRADAEWKAYLLRTDQGIPAEVSSYDDRGRTLYQVVRTDG